MLACKIGLPSKGRNAVLECNQARKAFVTATTRTNPIPRFVAKGYSTATAVDLASVAPSKRSSQESYYATPGSSSRDSTSPERQHTQRHGSVHHRHRHAPNSTSLKKGLRALLRDTAQPVAVVTSFMPDATTDTHVVSGGSAQRFHGATLSSFTSISMDPHPLVAFALRIPSRMASTLTSFSSHLHPISPSSVHPFEHRKHTQNADMVINLLSHNQAEVANKFSRPDLFPHPFSSTPYSLTNDGLPILHGSLGAISCRLIAPPLKLSELGGVRHEEAEAEEAPEAQEGSGVVSELFIARVVRVESFSYSGSTPEGEDGEDPSLSPLLYYKRKYTTC